jgi:hypothetical protein
MHTRSCSGACAWLRVTLYEAGMVSSSMNGAEGRKECNAIKLSCVTGAQHCLTEQRQPGLHTLCTCMHMYIEDACKR